MSDSSQSVDRLRILIREYLDDLPDVRTLAAIAAMQGLLSGDMDVPVDCDRHKFLADEAVKCGAALLARLNETEGGV